MDFTTSDLLWLLLPVAAATGWLWAKRDSQQQAPRRSRELTTAYFSGLNYLLNEQPDKAIEVLLRALEVDSGTVETHLALGNLFRRRGEVERAIRIHQNLIARPTLDRQQRSQALLELGQDFMKAGLYDRAESLFQELAEVPDYNEQALRLLMRIYQQEREWESAISVARRLAALSGDRLDDVIAQYECELGEAAFAKNNLSLARRCGERALATDATCVRASMLLGRLALAEGRPEEALRLFRRVEDQDSRFIDEAIADIARCYQSIGDITGLADYFRHLSSRHPTIGVQLAQADFLRQQKGVEASEQFVVEWVRRHPSPQGLHRLVELHIEETTGAAREDLVILRGILEALIGKERGYGCTHCGFRAKSLYWSCPGCGRWKTFVQRTDLNETGPDTSAIIE